MGKLANWRLVIALLAIVAAGLTVTACGGGSSSSSESSTTEVEEETGGATEETASSEEGESDGGETENAAEIVEAPPTAPPNEFPITEPIKEKPPAKHKVIWLACSLPACQEEISLGYKKAAAALGWEFEQINYNALKAAEAVQSALNKNPEAIFITGIPVAAFEAQAEEAIKKGIPIFSGYDLTEPEPEKNGLYYQYLNKGSYGEEAEHLSNWVINDSHGEAHVAFVVVEEYPVLVWQVEAAEMAYKAGCPKCTVERVPVTLEDVEGGKVPAKVAAFVQSHPDVNYLQFTFGDLLPGVEAALQSAGIEGTKFIGVASTAAILKEIIEGKVAAWTAQPAQFAGWMSLDAAIRVLEGSPLPEYEKKGETPTWVVDSKSSAEQLLKESEGGGGWPGPAGFEEKFEKLWGL